MTRQHASFRTLAALCATLCAVAALAPAAPARAQSSTTDARASLKPGLNDAGAAAKGLALVAHRVKPDDFHPNAPGGLTYANSDLAFGGHYLYQGNFSGLQIWDIANPLEPKLTQSNLCFTEQGDVSIYGNLLFVSAENTGSRLDCGTQGVRDSVSRERMLGIRIFDVSDPLHPKQVADVQTCRGSHTHTLVPDPADKGVVYVYVSGLARVRSSGEMPGCEGGDITDPNTALFRIEVIRVPLAHPEQARIVSSPRIFNGLTAPSTHGVAYADTANGAGVEEARRSLRRLQLPASTTAADSARIALLYATLRMERSDTARARALTDSLRQLGVDVRALGGGGARGGPSQCHDITVYPALGLAAGACSGYGILLDIKDPLHPVRLQAVADSNFAFWHSATFSNDGSKLLFTDEWGGGTQPKCRATDPIEWGADALFTLRHDTLTQVGYFKMPAAQTAQENCVAHNGGLIPVPGRDVMVQAWYQGGISVFDWTDPAHPKEIAYFDRGPVDSSAMVIGGYWGGYYYNGYIYGSEIARGLDVFELTPSADLTQNEIDAAKLVRFDRLNPQSQPKLVWPAAFPVARAYLDQLVRGHGLPEARTSAIARALTAAERASGAARARALGKLAAELDRDARGASDAPRVRALATVVKGLERAKS
ncbi:MAG: LVIVD repeat-containing protein [Gemmatimonadaceae bacterium]